jgi:hypothetical protein
MTTSNRIVRVKARLFSTGTQRFIIAQHEFDVSLPEDKTVADLWTPVSEAGEFEDCVTNEINGEARLHMFAPEDLDIRPQLYLYNAVAEHRVDAGGFLLLTSIIKTYGESSGLSESERLSTMNLTMTFDLVEDAKSHRKCGTVGEFSSKLWDEAEEALSSLRIQSGLQLGECENLTEIFENSLTSEFVADLLGSEDAITETRKRIGTQRVNLAMKQLALIKLEKQLYKLAGKKVPQILRDGVSAYH